MTTLDETRIVDDEVARGVYAKSGRCTDLSEVRAEITRLGLAPYVVELDTQGWTVVPPELVAPAEFTVRLRQAVSDVVEHRIGRRPDLEGAQVQGPTPFGHIASYLLFEDPVFQEAIINPVALTLAHYLVGKSAILYTCQAFIKGPGGTELPLHSDNVMVPAPFPPYAQICNATWLLTDYSKDNGATCFVPGSNHAHRHPEAGEAYGDRVAIEAPAGSILLWHGNTWHGSFLRTNPGLRMAVAMMYCRMYVMPQEPYQADVTQDVIDRNPPAFAKLLGQRHPFGYRAEGIDFSKVAGMPGGSPWD